MIQLDQVSIRRGTRLLLNDANIQLHHGWHVGLTGGNGTGKSTLFAALQGKLSVDTGMLHTPKNWVVAHMAQEINAGDMTALDFVLSGDAEWFALNQTLADDVSTLADDEIARLHSRFDDIDGFTAPTRAAQMLSGLGFKQGDHTRAVNDFSGGWQMRLNLAKTLMCRSDLLLLDEPTNHLDLDAILWLEDWLKGYAGTLILISHDQTFLDAVVGHILHIEHQTLTLYVGNYSQFLHVRSERLAQRTQAIKAQEATRAHLQSYIDRFRAKATKAKQAQSRIKQLEKLELLTPILSEREFSLRFFEPEQMSSPLLKLTSGDIGYAQNNIIIHQVDLEITPDTRLGLLGVNGAGKSTLIKSLVGDLPLLTGKLSGSEHLKIGYFSQHNTDALENNSTPLVLLRRLAGKTSDADLRAFLGSFGFTGERIDTQVDIFSGGERARLALALIVWQRPNLLILDEPTNHLDMQMKQALMLALQNFTGALLLVSHDRELISTVCDELCLVDAGKCTPFSGDISDYAAWLRRQRKDSQLSDSDFTTAAKNTAITRSDTTHSSATTPQNTQLSKEKRRKLAAEQRKQTAPLRKQIAKLESELEATTDKLATIETQLADANIYEPEHKDRLMQLMSEQGILKQSLENTEEQLLEMMDTLETMEADF